MFDFFNVQFVLTAILLGAGLAMDAFSVSLANGLNESQMRAPRMGLMAGTFALFQFSMPMIGWFFVHTVAEKLAAFQKCVPWIALLLLLFIGGKMLFESIRELRAAKSGEQQETTAKSATALTLTALLVQGFATSIDALSVGFTFVDMQYQLLAAFFCSLIIAVVTYFICQMGLLLGKRFGTRLSGKAGVLGGVILIAIGLEIFITGMIG